MRTTDIFGHNKAKKINESIEKVFGKKLALETFTVAQLEDARNRLRTQVSQVRDGSGFNETIENEALTQAQWMLDSINAELAERFEQTAIHPAEVSTSEGYSSEVEEFFHKVAQAGEWDMLYDAQSGKYGPEIEAAVQDMYDDASIEYGLHPDDDFEEILEKVMNEIEQDYSESDADTEPAGSYDMSDDADALASAGFGSDEDYESIETEGYTKFGSRYAEELALKVFKDNPNLTAKGRADEVLDAGWKFAVQDLGKKRAQWEFNYDEDFPSDFVSAYGWLQDGGEPETGKDGEEYTKKYGHLFKGRDEATESAPPTAKGERMVKHIKKGYAKDGKLTDKEKSIAYATAWKQHNKEQNESFESGENMNQVRESAADKAGAVVVAKDMTDKVGRWIEELSGMENDTLLNLGDTIRDEMGQEQAKAYLEVVAPAIQQALAGLKTTRETLASGMRSLTGEEQSAEVIGSEPPSEEPGMEVVAPDEMNAGAELPPEPGAEDDAFAASEPATGGLEAAGREQRESIQFQNRLLSVLAG